MVSSNRVRGSDNTAGYNAGRMVRVYSGARQSYRVTGLQPNTLYRFALQLEGRRAVSACSGACHVLTIPSPALWPDECVAAQHKSVGDFISAIPSRLDAAAAKDWAGGKWDEAVFEAIEKKDDNGCITKAQFQEAGFIDLDKEIAAQSRARAQAPAWLLARSSRQFVVRWCAAPFGAHKYYLEVKLVEVLAGGYDAATGAAAKARARARERRNQTHAPGETDYESGPLATNPDGSGQWRVVKTVPGHVGAVAEEDAYSARGSR
jgi:hypothetical protein